MKKLTRYCFVALELLFSSIACFWPSLVVATEVDVTGNWSLSAKGISVGCTEHTPCQAGPPYLCGTGICGSFQMGDPGINVSQYDTVISALDVDSNGNPFTLDGIVSGNSVTFTIQGIGITPGIGPATTTYTGTLNGNTIDGTIYGYASWTYLDGNGNTVIESATWTGTFVVTISKDDIPNCMDIGDCVTISGPTDTVLYRNVSKGQTITLSAISGTSGGKYQWNIVEGTDKIQFVGVPSGQSVVLQGINPSVSLKDVTVKLTYIKDNYMEEDAHNITVKIPVSLYLEGSNNKLEYNVLGYLSKYTTSYYFHAMDQFLDPILIEGISVEEKTKIACRYRHINRLDPADSSTSNGGFIVDDVGTGDEFTNFVLYPLGIPKNFYMKAQQRIYIGGLFVGNRCQVYYYDYATSEEGICSKCK